MHKNHSKGNEKDKCYLCYHIDIVGNVCKEIFLKGEKRTDDIVNCVRSGKVYKITFKSHKTYIYNYYDVKIVEPSKEELFIDSRCGKNS